MNTKQLILLVEDSRSQALMLTNVLQNAGWDVIHAETAEKSLEALGRATPDLILIDYYLPGVRGDELCRQIRMRIDTRMIPIVILTGDAAQEVELHGLESGADDFLAKSTDTAVLVLRLRTLLAKTRGHSPAAPAEVDFQNARILAIDDSKTYRAYLSTELEREGYYVSTFGSGQEALDRMEKEDFDCVLVDLVMPEMDGIEVCTRLNTLRVKKNKSVMVLMLTAKEDNQNLARALEAGADDFVGKSSEIVVIKGRIRALLRRKSYEDEHSRRLSSELRAKEIEAQHAVAQQKAAEARAALVDGLERAAVALKRSNEELQQFAYVASHDLQEPLRMVTSYVQLLERRCKDKLDDEAREFMAFVVEGVARMRNLINDLLAYSRVGTQEKNFVPVDPNSIVQDALKNLTMAMEESRAEIECDDLPQITGERTQLVQLFQNLIGNAIKYRGGSVPRIHVSARTEGRNCIFSIQDNGIGIEPQYFDRIFVIFQRLHSREEYPGTGIGLSICKKIVERHGGRIWIESAQGQGSTFLFSLPRAEKYVNAIPSLAAV